MLSVQELQPSQVDLIADYWFTASEQFLRSMGAEKGKLPQREDFCQLLLSQLSLPPSQKRAYCLLWLLDGMAVGHCNTNPTFYGSHAHMHLHLWQADNRKKGLGAAFVRLSLPCFFEKLQLRELISEPYTLNPAPNKTLEKAGFELEKEYVTIPGSINFEQPVKRWRMSRERFLRI